mgnify:CR=1 FL=1
MATKVYWYKVATNRNVETPDSFCLTTSRSRKATLIEIEQSLFIKKWRNQGWIISVGRRLVESTGDVLWEIWAHYESELKLKPIAKVYRVQTIDT